MQASQRERSFPVMMPVDHISGWHGMMTLRAEQGYTYVGVTNSSLIGLNKRVFNKREATPGSRNLVNNLLLVKSWLLENL